jgi:hypothetical protein
VCENVFAPVAVGREALGLLRLAGAKKLTASASDVRNIHVVERTKKEVNCTIGHWNGLRIKLPGCYHTDVVRQGAGVVIRKRPGTGFPGCGSLCCRACDGDLDTTKDRAQRGGYELDLAAAPRA